MKEIFEILIKIMPISVTILVIASAYLIFLYSKIHKSTNNLYEKQASYYKGLAEHVKPLAEALESESSAFMNISTFKNEEIQKLVGEKEGLERDLQELNEKVKNELKDQSRKSISGKSLEMNFISDKIISGQMNLEKKEALASGKNIFSTPLKVFHDPKIRNEKDRFEYIISMEIPMNNFDFDEKQFKELLAGSVSLYFEEKIEIIRRIPSLALTQFNNLLDGLKREHIKFLNLIIDKLGKKSELIQLGKFYIRVNEFDNAKLIFSKAVENGINDGNLHLGILHEKISDFDNAIHYYSEAIKHDNHDAYYRLARLFFHLKNYKESKRYYMETVKFQPNKLVAVFELIEVLIVSDEASIASSLIQENESKQLKAKDRALLETFRSICSKIMRPDLPLESGKLEKLVALRPQIKWSFDEIKEWLKSTGENDTNRNKEIFNLIQMVNKLGI